METGYKSSLQTEAKSTEITKMLIYYKLCLTQLHKPRFRKHSPHYLTLYSFAFEKRFQQCYRKKNRGKNITKISRNVPFNRHVIMDIQKADQTIGPKETCIPSCSIIRSEIKKNLFYLRQFYLCMNLDLTYIYLILGIVNLYNHINLGN